MSHVILTQTLLDAPAERVWRELTDFAAFPSWNPFIVRAEGELRPGAEIRIRLALGNRMHSNLRPRVTLVEPERELRWEARTGPRGVFDVERIFRLKPENGRVRFEMSELCTGALAPLILAAGLRRRLYRGYEAMNSALRARVEPGATATTPGHPAGP